MILGAGVSNVDAPQSLPLLVMPGAATARFAGLTFLDGVAVRGSSIIAARFCNRPPLSSRGRRSVCFLQSTGIPSTLSDGSCRPLSDSAVTLGEMPRDALGDNRGRRGHGESFTMRVAEG